MKTKSRNSLITSLTMIVMMIAILFGVVAIAPLTAYAASGTGTESDPYVVTTYAELRDLMAKAPTDGTTRYIKLGGDITENDIQNDHSLTLTQEGQNVVLDLAGYKITRNSTITVDKGVIRAKKGKLTINDSEGTGGVYAKGELEATIALTSTDAVDKDRGTIIINGGTYENEYSLGNAVYNESAYLYINSGTFRSKSTALYLQAGSSFIYGGEYYSTNTSDVVSLAVNQNIEIYNFKAYGNVKSNSAQADLWDYIREEGNVFVNGTKQSKTKAWKFEGSTVEVETDMVDNIWITATTPVVGNTIPNSVDIPYGADYEIVEEYGNQVVAWMKNGNPVSTETFEASTAYTLRVYVKVNAATTMDIDANVNGQPANLEFVIEAMEGYKYYWVEYTFPATIDNVIPSANVTVTVPVADATAIAGIIFNSEKYTVSIGWSTTANGSNGGDFNEQTFVAGNTYYADLSLVAEDPYIFADGATVFVNGTEYTSVWMLGSEYKKYVAVYDIPFTVPNADTYTVSFNANGGTGSMLDETEQLGVLVLPECGFTAPTGRQFKCWAEGGTGGDQYAAGEEYNVTANVTFYAIWEDIPATKYDVVYGIGEGQGSGASESVDEGTEITLDSYETIGMVAPNGKIFDYWSIRIGTAQSAETAQKQAGDKITINADTYIIAIWKDAPITNYTITATADANGTISPSGEVSVAEGEDKTFTITANSGYHIKDVKVNGVSVGTVSTYTFNDVAANATITVEFEVDTVPHVCNPTLVPKVEPNCTTAGKSAYYHCECGKNYEDAQGNSVISNLETWGILNALGHETQDVWSTDGEYHWHKCTRCEEQLDKAAHSGGTATCTEKAVCATCNIAYGNTAAHEHGSEWHKNADEHWNECACGDKANVAPHADEDNDGKCDICDYAMGTPENPGENIESEKTGLSGGAIAGIAVGSVAVAGLGGFSLFWFVIKKKKFADLIALFKKK